MKETRSLTTTVVRKLRAINWIVAGAAILALAAMAPSIARAQILTLSPTSAINVAGGTHTVTATLTGGPGHCADGSPSCDGSGYCDKACTSNADCADPSGDDYCNFGAVTGQTIFIGVVSGPNSGSAAVQTTVDVNGQATFSYTSTVAGTDTLEACLDSDGAGEEGTGSASGDLAACITDTASAEDGPTSNTVTKTWVQTGVILTPSTAYNPVGAIHTVTAQVTGICSELDGTPSCDGSGYCDVSCTSNADCDDTAIMALTTTSATSAASWVRRSTSELWAGLIAGRSRRRRRLMPTVRRRSNTPAPFRELTRSRAVWIRTGAQTRAPALLQAIWPCVFSTAAPRAVTRRATR